MKVHELIAHLHTLPQDAEVTLPYIWDRDDAWREPLQPQQIETSRGAKKNDGASYRMNVKSDSQVDIVCIG